MPDTTTTTKPDPLADVREYCAMFIPRGTRVYAIARRKKAGPTVYYSFYVIADNGTRLQWLDGWMSRALGMPVRQGSAWSGAEGIKCPAAGTDGARNAVVNLSRWLYGDANALTFEVL